MRTEVAAVAPERVRRCRRHLPRLSREYDQGTVNVSLVFLFVPPFLPGVAQDSYIAQYHLLVIRYSMYW